MIRDLSEHPVQIQAAPRSDEVRAMAQASEDLGSGPAGADLLSAQHVVGRMPLPGQLICLIAARQPGHARVQLLQRDRLGEKGSGERFMENLRPPVAIEATRRLDRPQGRNRAVIVDRQLQPEPGSHIAMQLISVSAAVVQLCRHTIEVAAGDCNVDVITTGITVPRGKPAMAMMPDRQSRQHRHGDPQPELIPRMKPLRQ